MVQFVEEYSLLFFLIELKFKGPAKSFGYWGLKLLPGIRVIAESLAQRPRPEPPTPLELHLFKLTLLDNFQHLATRFFSSSTRE